MAFCPFLSSEEKKVNCSMMCALYIANNKVTKTSSCAFTSIAKNLETLDFLTDNTNAQLIQIKRSIQ